MLELLEPAEAKKYHTAAYEQLLTTVIQRTHFHRLLHYAAFGMPGRTPTKFQYYSHDELEEYMHRAGLIVCIGRDLQNAGDLVLSSGAHSNARVSAMLYSLACQAGNNEIKLVFSSWMNNYRDIVSHSHLSEARLLSEYVHALGVPARSIIEEDDAAHTVVDFLDLLRYKKDFSQRGVVIVATKDRMPRTAWFVDHILPEDIEVCLVESDPMLSRDQFNISCVREKKLLLSAMSIPGLESNN